MSNVSIEKKRRNEIVRELREGERSGFVKKFDRKKFIRRLHGKYPDSEVSTE